jgi:hypothetical protein
MKMTKYMVMCLATLGMTGIVSGQTLYRSDLPNPAFNNPHRNINGHVSDLTPLLQWWKLKEKIKDGSLGGRIPKPGERPLTNWYYITGKYVFVHAQGWTVDAAIEDNPGHVVYRSRIVLRNPPVEERKRIEGLIAEERSLSNAIPVAEHEASRASTEYWRNQSQTFFLSDGREFYRSTTVAKKAARAANDTAAAHDDYTSMRKRLQDVRNELRGIRPREYTVKVFAQWVGTYQPTGSPIYDCGQAK